ncbi:MAG: RNA polymerase sigma factor [Cyclobacteriaceae bacterium]|nr:RNA polymerase sigma factor [Cyclobacteriaceae bacterium]
MASLTDSELIVSIVAGNRSAFRELYDKYKSRVYNTAISYLQSVADAEEVTQDVFVEIFHSAAKFKGQSSVGTWVYRITVNKCLDYLRYRNRKKRMGFLASLFGESNELKVDAPHFEHPGVLLENKEKSTYLFQAIDKLPEQQKSAFILSQIEELPQKEVAEVMQLSQKAVESLIQRAKGNLRKELEKFYLERRK